MTYTVEIKVMAVIIPNEKKMEIEQVFHGCDFTKIGAMKSAEKQMKNYSHNPYVEKVEKISVKFI